MQSNTQNGRGGRGGGRGGRNSGRGRGGQRSSPGQADYSSVPPPASLLTTSSPHAFSSPHAGPWVPRVPTQRATAHHTSAKHKQTSRNSFGPGSKLFGTGAEAVEYEEDKEAGTWKVGPPVQTGARFSRGFLRGLSLWLDGAAPCASGGAQISAAVANLSLNGHVDGQSSAATATGANDSRVRLSVRLELMELTDQEVIMFVAWCASEAPRMVLRKLWLFNNAIGDDGAVAVASLMHSGLSEVHLSHNRVGLIGAVAIIRAIPAPQLQVPSAPMLGTRTPTSAGSGFGAPSLPPPPLPPTPPPPQQQRARPHRGLWLRMEWNQVPFAGILAVLQEERDARGLVSDVPDQATLLSKSKMTYTSCHVCLPWLQGQRQAPSEAESLSAARSAWGRAAAGPSTPPAPTASGASAPPQPTPPPFRLLSAAAPGCVAPGAAERRTTSAEAPPLEPFGTPERSAAGDVGGPAAAGGTVAGSGHAIPALAPASGPSAPAPCVRGPLMLFPDTSAVLAMVGAANTRATPLSFQRLEELASRGLFGRTLPPEEQVFIVLTDSVAKQLDGLKSNPACSSAVRRFFSHTLDACGPAGLDFLSVLGAHEGEGLVWDRGAEVAASSGRRHLGGRGQLIDLQIIDVAALYQDELRRSYDAARQGSAAAAAAAAASAVSGSAASAEDGTEEEKEEEEGQQRPRVLPVLLLSGDNGQIQQARSHGVPAVRMVDAADALAAAVDGGAALTATRLRTALASEATAGVNDRGSGAANLQREFDASVACLRLAAEALSASTDRLASVRALAESADAGTDPSAVLSFIREALLFAPPPPQSPAPESPARTGSGEGEATSSPSATPGSRSASGTPSDPEAAAAGGGAPPPASAEDLVGANEALLAMLEQRLEQWDGVVRSFESPSRVLRWTRRDDTTAG